MKTSDASNRPTTATTSTSAPASKTAPAIPADEAAFLRKQEQDAKQAISRVFDVIKDDLKAGADPRAWTREYPWLSVSAAAVAGFVAACVIVPTKEEQALKRLAAIEQALHPQPEQAVNGEQNGHGPSGGHSRARSILSGLGWQFFGILRPILMSVITAGIAAKTAKETVQQGTEPGGADGSGAYPPS